MEKSESSQNYYLGIGAGDREGHWEGIREGDRAGLGLDQDHQDQRDETESHLKIIHSPSKSQKFPNIFCIQNRYRFPPKRSKQVHFSMKSLQVATTINLCGSCSDYCEYSEYCEHFPLKYSNCVFVKIFAGCNNDQPLWRLPRPQRRAREHPGTLIT